MFSIAIAQSRPCEKSVVVRFVSMPALAIHVIETWRDAHPSMKHLHLMLRTLLRPCASLRFGLIDPKQSLRYSNIVSCAALGFPYEWPPMMQALREFQSYSEHRAVIDYCVTQHVYRRRKALQGRETATEEWQECRDYMDTALQLIEFLSERESGVFIVPPDWTEDVVMRVRFLLFRAFCLFCLRQLFYRAEPGVTLPRVRSLGKITHAYFLVRSHANLRAAGISFDPDAPAAKSLGVSELYSIKSTDVAFLHDLVNNYDYRTTILNADATPPDGADEFTAMSIYALELQELDDAGALAISSEDSYGRFMFAASRMDSTIETISVTAEELFDSRHFLDANTAQVLESTLKAYPTRFEGDPAAAFYLLLLHHGERLGLANVTAQRHSGPHRRRVDVAAISFDMDVDDVADPSENPFDVVLRRFKAQCCDTHGFTASEPLKVAQVELACRWGFMYALDAPTHGSQLSTIARMILNRIDDTSFPTLAVPAIANTNDVSSHDGGTTSADVNFAALLASAAPLGLVLRFVELAREAPHQVAPYDEETVVVQCAARLCLWAALTLHFQPAVLQTSLSASQVANRTRAVDLAANVLDTVCSAFVPACVSTMARWTLPLATAPNRHARADLANRVLGATAASSLLILVVVEAASEFLTDRKACTADVHAVGRRLLPLLRVVLSYGCVHRQAHAQGSTFGELEGEVSWRANCMPLPSTLDVADSFAIVSHREPFGSPLGNDDGACPLTVPTPVIAALVLRRELLLRAAASEHCDVFRLAYRCFSGE
jgi:hypothetical protein